MYQCCRILSEAKDSTMKQLLNMLKVIAIKAFISCMLGVTSSRGAGVGRSLVQSITGLPRSSSFHGTLDEWSAKTQCFSPAPLTRPE